MVFQPSRTYKDPFDGSNVNRGFPSPGAYGQTTGDFSPPPVASAWVPERPSKGRRSWLDAIFGASANRGFPAPQGRAQARPPGSFMDNPAPDGFAHYVEYPYFSRGDGARAPQLGQVSYDPIGGGVVALHRTQASYGPAAQYENGEIFWTSQAVPTSVNLQGLTNPDILAAVIGPINVQAAVRVNG